MGINRSAWWSSLRIVSASLLAARDVLRNVISSDVRSATKQGCSQAKTGPLQEVYSNSSLLFRQRDLPRSLATPPGVQFLACNGALGVSHWTQGSLTEPPSREEAEGRDFLFLPSITPCLISIKNFKFRGFHGSRRFFTAGLDNRFSTQLPPKKERISRFLANPKSGF